MSELAPSVVKRLVKELTDLQKSPPEGIRVSINEANLADVGFELDGPVGTPYEHGVFKGRLALGGDFPTTPPRGYFLTKIFHPNVSGTGDICVNVLKKDWTPDTELKHILVVIKCLLVDPNPESALNEEAGRLLLEDYEEYASRARLITSVHAITRRPGPLTASGGNTAAASSAAAGGDVGKPGAVVGSSTSPASKKVKGDAGAGAASKPAAAVSAAAKVKKSLKRL